MNNFAGRIVKIIAANFPNGIRDDFIDTNKVLRIYSANYADENISRAQIIDLIHSNGLENGGRFYFVAETAIAEIQKFFDELLKKNSIIFYSEAYIKHSEFFSSRHIFSPGVLKKILQEVDDDNFYFEEFCSSNKTARLDREVSKIFMAAEKSLSPEDLQSSLPYVSAEKISALLSDTKKYLPTTTGRFISLAKVQFDSEEIGAVKRQIYSLIDAKGYAAPEDYDLSSNFALNPEVSEKDLRRLIYEKFFFADFTRRGKNFFPKFVFALKKNSVSELREFVAEQEELSVEKLLAFAESLEVAQHLALNVAYEKMIRVEKNLLVRDSLISFDVDGIDDALTPFVQGKIIPLRAVTSFTGFPNVAGCSWNLFLLESFLRKFSRKYSYDTAATNNANIGAIYPKSLKFNDYLDVQVAVVVQENITLEKSAVENFLLNRGFRARRNDKVVKRIIQGAQKILRL